MMTPVGLFIYFWLWIHLNRVDVFINHEFMFIPMVYDLYNIDLIYSDGDYEI